MVPTQLAAFLTILAISPPIASARKMTLINSCRQTIWPGIFAEPGPMPDHATGWEMKPGSQEMVEVDEHWTSGRFWARTGCTVQDGKFQCLTGDCHLGTQGETHVCETTNQPATLAEFTLGDTNLWLDHYDVSNVDGFNVPMSITPSHADCKVPQCKANINEICPEVLRGGIDQNGVNGACFSSCQAGFGEVQGGNRACCSGDGFGTLETCPPCGVDYYQIFKDQCPDAYAYAYDEKSPGQAIFTCPYKPESASDYTIEFCPGSKSFMGVTKASTQYEGDKWLAQCPNDGEKGIVAGAGAKPSPTAGQPQSPLKVKLSDGDKPDVGLPQTSATSRPLESAQSAAEPTVTNAQNNQDHLPPAQTKPEQGHEHEDQQVEGANEAQFGQEQDHAGGRDGDATGDGNSGGDRGNAGEWGTHRQAQKPDAQVDDVQHLATGDLVQTSRTATATGRRECPAKKRKRSRA